jgi:hypothetical protein
MRWLTSLATALVFGMVSAQTSTSADVKVDHPGGLTLWAVGDMVRIDPETGKAFEDNPAQLPGGIARDYRSNNAFWSGKDKTVDLVAARNEVVAFQLIIEGTGTEF